MDRMSGLRERNGVAGEDRWARTRRQAVPPPGAAELARMMAEFQARGGAVTVCRPAYVLPVQGGAAI